MCSSDLIDELNNRTMRRIGSSRRALFEAIERPALQPLPDEPFEYAEWKRCRAGLDYHIEVHGHWYSVPYRLIREVVEARITDSVRFIDIVSPDRASCGFDGQRFALPTTPQPQQPHQ